MIWRVVEGLAWIWACVGFGAALAMGRSAATDSDDDAT